MKCNLQSRDPDAPPRATDTMAATSLYSVWLEPPTDLRIKAANFIDGQVACSPGCPSFAPHVTLAGGFRGSESDARARTAALASALVAPGAPFADGVASLRAKDVATGTRYHQCVYLRMEPTETLAAAHAAAARAFDLEPGNGNGEPYVPHLSLVYGETRDEIKADAADAATEALFCGVLRGFETREIVLWRTDVEDLTCESWARVERFPLVPEGGGNGGESSEEKTTAQRIIDEAEEEKKMKKKKKKKKKKNPMRWLKKRLGLVKGGGGDPARTRAA